MNILIVDDKQTVQDKLAALLTSQGHNVDLAINGLDALAKIQQGSYQLFVIDHLMPLMNGVQLTKNIKSNPIVSDTPVLFMTTQGTQSLKKLTEFTLFDKVIDKPIDEDSFFSAITDLSDNNFDSVPLRANA